MGGSCPHKHTELLITGSMHFAAGDVWDDIREEVYCLDCHQTLDENQLKEAATRQRKYLLWRGWLSRKKNLRRLAKQKITISQGE